MSTHITAYLVVRRDDSFGDVFPLVSGERYTLGRAATNAFVLHDNLCSRVHAEIAYTSGKWRVRDLGSTNGTQVNNHLVEDECDLVPSDELLLGNTHLMFVEHLDQFPDLPSEMIEMIEGSNGTIFIKKRLSKTHFLPPPFDAQTTRDGSSSRHNLSRDMALLYRLSLDMGMADSHEKLCRIVLETLLEATSADVGAILSADAGSRGKSELSRSISASQVNDEPHRPIDFELTVYIDRNRYCQDYAPVSVSVTKKVLATREAILARCVTSHHLLGYSQSLVDLNAKSLICAPILFGEKVLGLIHLYSRVTEQALEGEDLEFTVAVAKQLGGVIHNLQKQQSLSAENRSLRDQLKVESELVGESAPIREIERQISLVANTNATCLIRGESGVGKELVARAIHYSSARKDGPFVCLNCAALTETLLESELFGHEKGSFTGATEKKVGKFEAANRGTIFLDEIGEMNVGTQAKLLRILEGHPFERVGGSQPIRVDVRVVSATNAPLEEAVRDGNFRRDLFFRLQVVEIRVPPLRERKGDIRQIAGHFLQRFVRETGRKICGFSELAYKKMEDYQWPGNIRELRNVVERAVALGVGPMLTAGDIWLSLLEAPASTLPHHSFIEMEKHYILRTLEYTTWNISQVTEILGIQKQDLELKIKEYGLVEPQVADHLQTGQEPDCTPATAKCDIGQARKDLRRISQTLEDHGWKISESSQILFRNRFRLTRQVKKHMCTFPTLRTEQEFTPLIRRLKL